MTDRYAVLDEFSEGSVTRYHNVHALADEIVRLRAVSARERAVIDAAVAWYDATEKEGDECYHSEHYDCATCEAIRDAAVASADALITAVRSLREVTP